jgi:hypothetical protein
MLKQMKLIKNQLGWQAPINVISSWSQLCSHNVPMTVNPTEHHVLAGSGQATLFESLYIIILYLRN